MTACDREDDEDYAAESCAERFRKLNPDWTEEELHAYLCQSEPASPFPTNTETK